MFGKHLNSLLLMMLFAGLSSCGDKDRYREYINSCEAADSRLSSLFKNEQMTIKSFLMPPLYYVLMESKHAQLSNDSVQILAAPYQDHVTYRLEMSDYFRLPASDVLSEYSSSPTLSLEQILSSSLFLVLGQDTLFKPSVFVMENTRDDLPMYAHVSFHKKDFSVLTSCKLFISLPGQPEGVCINECSKQVLDSYSKLN
jgi:uncharacterized lipoprotein YehR (DUF1307 family)